MEVDQIDGDQADLLGTPLLLAEVVSSEGAPAKEEYEESFTWTFYKFATPLGYVTIKWYGSSNGYYSEEVSQWYQPADGTPGFGDYGCPESE